jgi:hypothetical protein
MAEISYCRHRFPPVVIQHAESRTIQRLPKADLSRRLIQINGRSAEDDIL